MDVLSPMSAVRRPRLIEVDDRRRLLWTMRRYVSGSLHWYARDVTTSSGLRSQPCRAGRPPYISAPPASATRSRLSALLTVLAAFRDLKWTSVGSDKSFCPN